MDLSEPRAGHWSGWGPDGSDSSDVIEAWKLYIRDTTDESVEIIIDVTNEGSPIIIDMDVKMYEINNNRITPRRW